MRGSCYREIRGMPLTRREYVDGIPNIRIAKFTAGTASPEHDYKLQLIAKERGQIRHNALEAARVAINKNIHEIGEKNYFLLLKVYPHVVLKENKMIATAGADRLQEGMRKAWGKPIGLAARVKPGKVIFELTVRKEWVDLAKKALKVGASKLPIPTTITIKELKKEIKASV
jgi:large subunit ribosomal protein L10e